MDATRDDGRPRCPQCLRALEDAVRTSEGLAICPQCAHSVAPPDHDERSTELYLPDSVLHTTGEDRFRLAGRLGEGGFGTVYRAFDRSLRRNVAIKVPKKSAGGFDARQFILEARAASSLRHPNVVSVFDVGFNEGAPYIVSECIEGAPLRQWLDGPQATFDRIASVFEKLCRAIAYAHAMGVVHRDIKPSNVIVDDSNEPHVLDFGLSSSRVTGEAVTFRRNVPVGTPAYMAPEQANGDLDRIGTATDVYSLGVVLYQMLTRRLPFVGSAERILNLVVHEEPARPRTLEPKVPPSLEAIALKAMRKPIEDRYHSADALADDVGRYRRGEPVKALGRHDKRSLVMTARRKFMTGVAATATCGLLGSAVWLAYRRYQDDPRIRVRLEDNSNDETFTWLPLDGITGQVKSAGPTLATGDRSLRLEPGLYLVRGEKGSEVAEVYRTVPAPGAFRAAEVRVKGKTFMPRWETWTRLSHDSVILLPRIDLADRTTLRKGLTFIEGGEISYIKPGVKSDPMNGAKPVGDFWIEETAATVADVMDRFEIPLFNDGKPEDSEASLPFRFALELAERKGLSVMSAWEWLIAATNRGTTQFPWGDAMPDDGVVYDLASMDRLTSNPLVTGLFSGLGEWSVTQPTPSGRLGMDPNVRERKGSVAERRIRLVVGNPNRTPEDPSYPLGLRDRMCDFTGIEEQSPRGAAIRCVLREKVKSAGIAT